MLMSIFSSPIQAETHPDIATLTNLFNALQAVEKTIPRDSFEASAVLPNTELTPESLNTWVRENTWLIPYNGALRDAQGVLMDRVGNSLDRALLLQTMLRELGYDTRLAQSTLTEKQAKQVFIERRPLPINTLPTSIESPEQIEKLIKEFHLDPTQLAKIKAETEKTQQQLKTTLQERVERQTSELLKLLGTLPNPPPDESYKALQDHWWVQYQEKDQWFDLDPTLSAELAQQIHSTPLKIHDINKLDKLSPELLHSVIIKVILECYKDKKITENILTQTPPILPSDVLGKPVSVNHIAVNLPNDLNASDLNAFKETLQKQAHWFPVITVADQQYFDQEYTPDCVLSKAKPPQTGTAIDNKIEDILEEAFDTPDFPQNTPSAIPDSNTFITSMWLEYEVHTPNQPKQTIHRQLFDLIGAAQRAVGKIDKQPNEEQQLTWRLALLGGTDILAYGHGVSDDYLWKLSSQHLSKNYNPILQILENIDDLQIIKQEAKKLKPLSILLYTLAHLRSYSHQATFIDQLNIISIHRQLKHENTNLKLLEAFDIVKNNSFGKMQTFNNQVKQGVIDTNAEALLLLNCPAIQTEKCSESINTAKLWELAKAQNIKWQLIRTPQELHKLKISPDITQQMTTQLKQGYVVITPEKPILVNDKVITNWWVINPKTGHTLGIGETGWGTAMSEYISLLNVAISSSFCMALATSSRDIALCTVAMVLGFTGTTIGAAYQTGAALLNLTGTLVVGAPAVAKSVSRRSK
ncbi:transglutaminase domain-containing protein [Thiofilum flexile]|uniref:transglutaminase domain-containing protein n=1 Tax=Thiofilum flexile TaxID=125627 RepID=UPI000381F603|nr:transglutaminase domain-containing protein [Thiofilum flexile]